MAQANEKMRLDERLYSLVLEDDRGLAEAYKRILSKLGYEVEVTHTVSEARAAIRNQAPDLILVDIDLPDGNGLDLMEELRNDTRERFVVISGDASQRAVIKSIRHQAVELIRKPVELKELRARLTAIRDRVRTHHDNPLVSADCWVFHGSNPALVALRTAMSYNAELSRGQALLIGEPGLDKPSIANTLHRRGRRPGACIIVDCAEVKGSSALVRFFGQEEPDTGVITRQGFIERAAAGTLVLDNVEHLSENLQSWLVSFLDTGRFKRLNGLVGVEATVSVVGIAREQDTADVDLSVLRPDFLVRLTQQILIVPTLRQCRDDLARIAEYLLNEASVSRSDSPVFSSSSLSCIVRHKWSNNIRQLRSVIERALSATAPGHLVEIGELSDVESDKHSDILAWVGTTLWEMERQLLVATLARFEDDKELAAKTLGISLKTLYNRINSN